MAIIDQIPKSRIKIHYETEVNGKKRDKELPFKLIVMGDLSLGSSKDRQLDLEEREIREIGANASLDALMNDMDMSLKFNVDNKINPARNPTINVNLPIKSMKSLRPESIAESIPEIQSLLMIKKMVKELESYVDNNKKFRATILELMKNKDEMENFKKELPEIEKFKV
ncbi:type VI secretion system contractile sheath small subunit [Piscirickettsia litoralis]|uniref:Type VI secretion system-associated protein n=1 Tax=Piscirickettsia litoralis TaxID=1891921 RepID=A0ABX2ZXC1_9GAMM|nr:type VI secretion system contractile sheath small subunit [Piscirickettsia litoralis]ODN41254.1 type VI secretion system-associated protein [Piscirickettsia litoralis]